MIIKKIPNPKKSATKAVRIAGLGNYIVSPEKKNGKEKCIHHEALNFLTRDLDAQLAEMIALASETRSADPVDHWVISWQSNERPRVEQARAAVETFIEHCGLEGHQVLWGLHDDTDNLHVHIEVNRVHPNTLKTVKINKGFDREAGQQVCALIEHRQGWKSEKGSRYKVIDGKPVLCNGVDKREQLEPTAAARAMEQQTGIVSAQRIGIEDAAPIIAAARSWRELHDNLNSAGFRFERKGSGAIIFVGDVAVKASDVSRAASLSALQKRLGAYQPAKEISPNDYYHHTPQPYPVALGEKSGHGLRNLSECRVSILQEGGQAKRAGILSIDAQPDRHGIDGLRRETGRERDSGKSGNERGTTAATDTRTGKSGSGKHADNEAGQRGQLHADRPRRPLKNGQTGWDEYQVIRAELKAAKEAATNDQRKRQQGERDALFEKQKAERSELFSKSWKGQGVARNAMLSIMATRHTAEKQALREQQATERQELREQHPQLPRYSEWKEQPHVLQPAGQQVEVRKVSQPPQLSKTLSSLRHSTDLAGNYTYRLGDVAVFRDEGKSIAVLDQQSKQSIAAALAVAQNKYGSKLTLTGSAEFQERAVRAAVEYGLTIKFVDPALEARRLQLVEEQRAAQREAQSVAKQNQQAANQPQSTPEVQPVAVVLQPAQPQPTMLEVKADEVILAESWIAAQSKPRSQPRETGDGKVEFIVVHVADAVVLDHGRTIAPYPIPTFPIQPGQKIIINKDGSLSPAPARDKNVGRSLSLNGSF